MTDDCCSPQSPNTASNHPAVQPGLAACPTNQQVGKPVETLTLKSLLSLPLTQLASAEYRFCRAPDCPTVYYRADGLQCFDEVALRERVYQKHLDDEDVFVCYCFRHTVGSIRAELVQTGVSTVIDQITAGIQDGQCACDIRNPQGDCCLGNVRRVVAQIKNELADSSTPKARQNDLTNH